MKTLFAISEAQLGIFFSILYKDQTVETHNNFSLFFFLTLI